MLTKLDGTGTTRTLTWDAENKLAKAQINAATYEYTYGADNKRIIKTNKLATGDEHTVYAFGGELEVDPAGKWTKYIH